MAVTFALWYVRTVILADGLTGIARMERECEKKESLLQHVCQSVSGLGSKDTRWGGNDMIMLSFNPSFLPSQLSYYILASYLVNWQAAREAVSIAADVIIQYPFPWLNVRGSRIWMSKKKISSQTKLYLVQLWKVPNIYVYFCARFFFLFFVAYLSRFRWIMHHIHNFENGFRGVPQKGNKS